jgi:hypothetical protein
MRNYEKILTKNECKFALMDEITPVHVKSYGVEEFLAASEPSKKSS